MSSSQAPLVIADAASNGEFDVQDSDQIAASLTATAAEEGVPVLRWGESPDPAPPEWLVDGLFLMNATNSIAGDAGVGKSRALAHLMVRVASGETFLGRKTRRTPVLYLNFDDAESMPKLWAGRAARSIGQDIADLPIYYWTGDDLPDGTDKAAGLKDPAVLRSVIGMIELIRIRENEPLGAVVLDTFASAFPSLDSNDANHALEAHRIKMKLVEAAQGAALIETDHTAKRYDGPAKSASGSMQKKAKVRTLHTLEELEVAVHLANLKRLRWGVPKNNAGPQLTFNIRFRLDTADDKDFLEVEDAPVDTGSEKHDAALNLVLDTLKASPGQWFRRTELKSLAEKHSGAGSRTVVDALKALEDVNDVEVRTEAGQGNPKSLRYVSTPTTEATGAANAAHTAASLN